MNISRASTNDPILIEMLQKHLHVDDTIAGNDAGLIFSIGDWTRRITVGDWQAEFYGLVEIIDNNPLVCADTLSIPSPGVTAILIALAPLVQAGLLVEDPAIIVNFEVPEDELTSALGRLGWQGSFDLHCEPLALDGVIAATVMAAIPSEVMKPDLDSLFDEKFGRSFFVRQDQSSEWNRELVKGWPWAVYRFAVSPDDPTSLLTVRVLLDQNGKGGAGQILHAMNVMSGFEESLGLA